MPPMDHCSSFWCFTQETPANLKQRGPDPAQIRGVFDIPIVTCTKNLVQCLVYTYISDTVNVVHASHSIMILEIGFYSCDQHASTLLYLFLFRCIIYNSCKIWL